MRADTDALAALAAALEALPGVRADLLANDPSGVPTIEVSVLVADTDGGRVPRAVVRTVYDAPGAPWRGDAGIVGVDCRRAVGAVSVVVR